MGAKSTSFAGIVTVFVFCLIIKSLAISAVWTGLGNDDRWANPANWQNGIPPTIADQITFEPAAHSWQQGHTSVTIDSTAQIANITLNHYGLLFAPFNNITILPTANFRTGTEYIDQMAGSYTQTGGIHNVSGDFSYYTALGNFDMQAGELKVGGTINASPEGGTFRFSGGKISAGGLKIGLPQSNTTFQIAPSADVHIYDLLSFAGTSLNLSCQSPIFAHDADLANTAFSSPFAQNVMGFEQMELIFDSSNSEFSTFEIASADLGSDTQAMINNSAMKTLKIGNALPGFVKLIDDFSNTENWLDPLAPDCLYVDTLILTQNSILDLNGYKLYCNSLINDSGTFLNGSPIVIPEPASITILTLGSIVLLIRPRRR